MISRGNKRRGNKRTKHRASIPDPTPQPESTISAEQQFAEDAWQKRLAWLRRPRIQRSTFEEPLENEVETDEEVAERTRKQNELAKKLGWEPERLARFKQLALRYEKDPTIANYLQIRRDFPEADVEVGIFSGIDAPFKLEEKLAGQGFDPMLIVGALDADEHDIDAVCLHLLGLLEAKRNLPKEGVGFIEQRRKAISDATVNYLIVEMFEAIDRCGGWIRMPASLVVLLREQLCGSNPDVHQLYLTRQRFRQAAFNAGLRFEQTGEQLSVRKLADAYDVGRGTAARWLADKHFHLLFDRGRRFAASKDFLKWKKLSRTQLVRNVLGREQVSHQKTHE
jgi:hypothetical protein